MRLAFRGPKMASAILKGKVRRALLSGEDITTVLPDVYGTNDHQHNQMTAGAIEQHMREEARLLRQLRQIEAEEKQMCAAYAETEKEVAESRAAVATELAAKKVHFALLSMLRYHVYRFYRQ